MNFNLCEMVERYICPKDAKPKTKELLAKMCKEDGVLKWTHEGTWEDVQAQRELVAIAAQSEFHVVKNEDYKLEMYDSTAWLNYEKKND